jgi:hypothetical protein
VELIKTINKLLIVFQQALDGQYEFSREYLDKILSFEIKINDSLTEFIPTGKIYGMSYLVIRNFLGYLTKKYNITNWNDELLQPWITKSLLTYFQNTNPNFSESLITEWFQELFC